MSEFQGQIVDVVAGRIFPGRLIIESGRVESVIEDPEVQSGHFILPGLVDAHIHIESSMLIPSSFAHMAVVHGTVATVSDPHEIANVLGIRGVEFMLKNASRLPFRFYFGAPSCVPATAFETSGASLEPEDVASLLQRKEIKYLAEMMNFPGVLFDDPSVMKKIEAARALAKPVDGHAPGLRGDSLKKYVAAGISTDHECFTIEEAREKISLGMKVQIREGSAARNFDTLMPLLAESPDMVMFCSDDKHPDDLVKGHINRLLAKAIKAGYNPIDVIKAATLIPIMHYKLEKALLQSGQAADFIVVDNLQSFTVLQTYIKGERVADGGKSLMPKVNEIPVNVFNADPVTEEEIAISYTAGKVRVIEAIDGEIVTRSLETELSGVDGKLLADPEKDILKIVVMNRYSAAKPSVALIRGMGIKRGAIGSSVAHDSHNLIAVGADDESLVKVLNRLIESKGGICALDSNEEVLLELPFAGLMSDMDGYALAALYEKADRKAHEMGSTLKAPFMTLSFMALLVIPSLKLSDKGLFDANSFSFTNLFVS